MKKSIKFLSAMFALMLTVLVLTACGGNDNEPEPTPDPGPSGNDVVTPEPGGDDSNLPDGLEYVNGFYRFTTTQTISVPLWDRSAGRLPEFVESYWIQYITDGMLRDHNIALEWVTIPRWGEDEHISMLMGGNEAPDVSMTFPSGVVDTFSAMGGVIDLMPHLDAYRDLLGNLYTHLGEDVLYWNLDPATGELFSIMGREAVHGRVVTFVRQDWLAALGIDEPTTFDEFEAMLYEFQARADELPGDVNSQNIIPFGVSNDVMWDVTSLHESFISADITEREWFVNGWDDRRFMHRDATYQTLEIVNRWFNDGLLWEDLGIGENVDYQDQKRLGRVGSFMGNWDLAFRPGDQFTTALHENVGADAGWITITPFLADNGQPHTFLAAAPMRPIFFPHTNQNVLASLLYLDWMSRTEVLNHLQLGVQGTHWDRVDGAFVSLPEFFNCLDEDFDAEDEDAVCEVYEEWAWPDTQIMPSGRNFDITITANNTSDLEVLFSSYPGVSREVIDASRHIAINYGHTWPNVNLPARAAEEGQSALQSGASGGATWPAVHRLVRTSPENFSALFAEEWDAYLARGAGAILAEREAAWINAFGDVDSQP